ncbi:MAG: hypothetical protein ACOX0E_01060 [Syntrophomonadaceae bacterium]|jgi:hypothetical protein
MLLMIAGVLVGALHATQLALPSGAWTMHHLAWMAVTVRLWCGKFTFVRAYAKIYLVTKEIGYNL